MPGPTEQGANGRIPLHYGWVIVAAGALTLFACLGLARFAFGMLLPAMRTGLAALPTGLLPKPT
jgi:hypothetical protein